MVYTRMRGVHVFCQLNKPLAVNNEYTAFVVEIIRQKFEHKNQPFASVTSQNVSYV